MWKILETKLKIMLPSYKEEPVLYTWMNNTSPDEVYFKPTTIPLAGVNAKSCR